MSVGSGRGITEISGKPSTEGNLGENQPGSPTVIHLKILIPKNPFFKKDSVTFRVAVPAKLHRFVSSSFRKIQTITEKPSFRKISIALIVIFLLLAAAKETAEWYFVRRVLDLRGVKELTRGFINEELDRAVTLGVVEYEFPNHVFIEDLKISSDEDFASQRMIFKANKIELLLRGLWKGQPSVKAIRVRNAQLSIDLEDKISGEILSYIHKINIPEIRLEDTTVTVYKGGKVLLENVKGIDFNIRKEDTKINVQISDSLFPIPGFRYVNGKFSTDIGSKNMNLEILFKNAKAESSGGLYSEFSQFYPKKGKISGRAILESDGTNLKVQGKTEFSNVNGIVLQELPLQSEVWEWKDIDLEHEWTRDQKGDVFTEEHKVFSGEDKLTLLKSKNEKGLKTWDLSLTVQDLDDIRNFLPVSSDLETLGGSLDLHWKGAETGSYGDWMKSEAKFSLQDFRWKDPYLDLEIKDADLGWNPAGVLEAKLKGKQFGLPWSANLKGKTGYRKGVKGDGTAYFPLQGEYNLELETDSLVLSNFFPLYSSIRQWVREDIHTRMEKLIPEINFTRTPIYKYFLENPTGTLKLTAKEVKWDLGLPTMGKLDVGLKFAPSQSRLDANIAGTGTAKLNSYFTYGTDNPYFGIDFETINLAWGVPSFSFCGGDLIPESLDSDGNIRFNGNNFLDIHDRMYITIDKVKLSNTVWKGKGEFPVPVPPKFEMGFDYWNPGSPPKRNVYWKGGNVSATANSYIDSDSVKYFVTGNTYSLSSESNSAVPISAFAFKIKENSAGCVKE
ncbi:AsmA family protein [Leptospira venezuelensis]|uniref:LIC_12586 family protein n=1 Tax=Leptospira venezuelensis TaxID=1958811 RepID=UPI001F337455|nr:AsmA family protein [Leptospira venezuelensis]